MVYTIGVELRQYCTVTVEVNNDDEAFDLAAKAATSDDTDVDRNTPVADTCEIIASICNDDNVSDMLFEERREHNVA